MKLLQWQDILSQYGFNTCLPLCRLNKITIADVFQVLRKGCFVCTVLLFIMCALQDGMEHALGEGATNLVAIAGSLVHKMIQEAACMNENLRGGSALSGTHCTTSFEQKTV